MVGEGAGVGAAHEELEAELGVGPGQGRGDGVTEDDVAGEVFGDLAVEGLQGELGAAFVAGAGEEEGKMGEGRVAKLFAHVEFLVDEALEVVVSGKLDGGGVWSGGLDDDFARHLSATGAACDLGEELEGAFAGAEVGGVEGEVGIEDADEGDVGEVEALGDHLGAEEDIDFLGAEVAEGIAEGVFSPGGIGVEAGDFCGGEDFTEDDFGFLGAISLEADGGVLAVGAEPGNDGLVSANVADEALFGTVVGEGDGAVVALDDVSTGRALEGAGEAAAIQKDDDLFTVFEAFFDGSTKDFGDNGVAALLLSGFDAHVDDTGQGERGTVGPLGEMGEVVFAEEGVVVGFERRGGGAEENGALLEVATNDGEVACVVFRRVFLFVGGLVFFIDDDEAQVDDRGENGGASTDDDAGFATADAVPFVESFALREIGVENGDFVDEVVEAGFEALDGLGSEGDLWNEHDDVFSKIKGGLGGLEVNFGFP